ncbi:MAG TPA: hypothetical protein ENI66_01795 [Candidatus Yonathbacteria bacterium]|nr:hypothetical protein [Candidatus Yonathbacteria bacterium]
MSVENPNQPTAEEQANIETERTLSDAELIKGGAEYKVDEETSEKRLEVANEQVESAREDMEREGEDKERKEKAKQLQESLERINFDVGETGGSVFFEDGSSLGKKEYIIFGGIDVSSGKVKIGILDKERFERDESTIDRHLSKGEILNKHLFGIDRKDPSQEYFDMREYDILDIKSIGRQFRGI